MEPWNLEIERLLSESEAKLKEAMLMLNKASSELSHTPELSAKQIGSLMYGIGKKTQANARIAKELAIATLQVEINNYYAWFESGRDRTDYARKKEHARDLNGKLRAISAAIAHPNTEEPCILYALPTRNGNGRYTFETRSGKFRSGSYASLLDLLPFRLVPDIDRNQLED